ncbi:MAG TPA: S26 family signal peptidase [Pirellulaceae bacterium]|nr:S26 family signal peptidase [Pirellulaceae bacterium]
MAGSHAKWLAKWATVVTLILVFAAACGRLYLLDGWLRTVRIDGPSMAPALCGTHLAVTCSDCRIHFRVDAEQLPKSGQLVCPNCGFREIDAAKQPVQTGDTVLVDRWPLLTRMPQRWEVVAYDDPHASGAAVKRVAGLPGEKIAIREGDLYADGQIVRKSLAEFWQTAVLVHDDGYRPQSTADAQTRGFQRWRPSAAASRWQSASGEYRFPPADPEAAGEPDWLEYVHWRCDASLIPRDEPAAVLDNDPHNQALPRRLNEVHDLVLSCELELAAGGQLTVAAQARGAWLQVRLEGSRGTISASQDDNLLATSTSPRLLTGRPLKFAFGHLDAQLILAIDGDAVLMQPLDDLSPTADLATHAGPRLKIAAAGRAMVRHLRVWRDAYLLEPNGTDRPWTARQPLAEGEIFVLGDNPPVSIDSRHWQPSGISRGRIRGMVIVPQRSAP